MSEDGRNQQFAEVDFHSQSSDVFSHYQSDQELSGPEHTDNQKLALDEQVLKKTNFLDTKLAFFSKQQKKLGQHNAEIRSLNGSEETMALELLRAQQETITPLLNAVTDLHILQTRLAQAENDVRQQTLSKSEQLAASELITDLVNNITQLKQIIADFDTENFNSNASTLLESETVKIYAELAEKEKEMRKIMAEQQQKADEINLLKSRLCVLQAEDLPPENNSVHSRVTSALQDQSST